MSGNLELKPKEGSSFHRQNCFLPVPLHYKRGNGIHSTIITLLPETGEIKLSDDTNEIKEENLDGIPKPAEPCLKSSLRKRISDSSAPKQELKKRF
ncbi:hypothetical protein GBA52_021898 [Prunus armeniaca]|nr:hypothetical protein GBA52_021898 [Prunus armeniaca]